MSYLKDILPEIIYYGIQNHLIEKSKVAEDGWESGTSEEDTLTGHLGAILQTRWSDEIAVNGKSWKWRVRYKKFRGRGSRAFENISGADGIIQIEIDDLTNGEKTTKGILFQAKKGDIKKSKKLIHQVEKMETIMPKSSMVLLYKPDRYMAIKGCELLKSIEKKVIIQRETKIDLGSFLSDEFLACSSGVVGLYYDAARNVLILPNKERSKYLNLILYHRISIDIECK